MEVYEIKEDASATNGVLDATLIDDSENTDAPLIRQNARTLVLNPVKREEMYQHGRKLGLESGADEPNELALTALQEHARSQARSCYRPPFDPKAHPHDALLQAEMTDRQKKRDALRLAVKRALADVHEVQARVAKFQAVAPASLKLRGVLLAAGVCGFSVAFLLTYHDMVFLFPDQFLAWLASALAAIVTGLSIALFILADSSSKQRTLNYIGIAAGVLIALAFCGMRLKDAQTSSELIFAISLLVFELGLVIGLEGAARHLRQAQEEYAGKKAAQEEAAALLDAAYAHYEHCATELAAVEDAIQNDIANLEIRALQSTGIDNLETALAAAAKDGYYSGILANQAHLNAANGAMIYRPQGAA